MAQTLNLIFDVSNMMFRSLYTIRTTNYKGEKRFSNQEDLSTFVIKLTRDIAYIIRTYGPTARVFFVCDARNPWRKKILEDYPIGYKGARVKQYDIDWDSIFKSVNDLKDILRSKGFPVIEVDNAEADDVMALLKDKLFKNTSDNSLLFVTSDEDIRQLIEFNPKTSQFVTCLNPIAKRNDLTGSKILYLNESMQSFLDDKDDPDNKKLDESAYFDALFAPDISVESKHTTLLGKLLDKKRLVTEEADPTEIVLKKIFCGDDGDSVPPLYSYYTNKDKLRRITNSIFQKIIKDMDIKDPSDLDVYNDTTGEITNLDESIKKFLKFENYEYIPSTFIKRQRKLVELNPALFPSDIIEGFNEDYSEIENKFDSDYKIQNKVDLTYEDLLEDTQWLESSSSMSDNQVLDDLNKYIKSSSLESLFR